MNAGGHIAVAQRVRRARDTADSESYWLGSALPDFATMGGLRMLGSTPDPDIGAGIELHHRTDDVFHTHPWFSERNRAVAANLADAGVGRGPARACAHVGIELLLDGELMGDPALNAAIGVVHEAIEPRLAALEGLVTAANRDRWRQHLRRLAGWRLPDDYHDPEAVAQRLHRILAGRPRLALDEGDVATVAAVLADAQPEIKATAEDFLADLVDRIDDATPAAPRG